MKYLIILSALILPTAAYADANVRGTGTTTTADCRGGVANVRGTGVTVTITGACSSVVVGGSGNTVTVDVVAGAPITVTGMGNTIMWTAPRGPTPRLSVRGIGNTVLRGAARTVPQ